eukprot:TRINITY_DN19985_c0_g1_i1.p1 TRINITY_DN19985_c0_g1~~TRINITY_DN19985_c0_g1_i1.p1  ORF type:complete len:177 (-),score=30.19 TRINITY_DN19985_c0_g1_i1:144-647(-)
MASDAAVLISLDSDEEPEQARSAAGKETSRQGPGSESRDSEILRCSNLADAADSDSETELESTPPDEPSHALAGTGDRAKPRCAIIEVLATQDENCSTPGRCRDNLEPPSKRATLEGLGSLRTPEKHQAPAQELPMTDAKRCLRWALSSRWITNASELWPMPNEKPS